MTKAQVKYASTARVNGAAAVREQFVLAFGHHPLVIHRGREQVTALNAWAVIAVFRRKLHLA